MRGFTPTFRARHFRVDPTTRPIVEATAHKLGDQKSGSDDWNDADSLTGFEILPDGSLTIPGTQDVWTEHTVGTQQMTDLNRLEPFNVAMIEWDGGATDPDLTIRDITLRLHPDIASTGRLVDQWVMELHALHTIRQGPSVEELVLQPIGGKIVAAVGNSEADVVFDFTTDAVRPKPARLTPIQEGTTSFPDPVLFVFLFAVTNAGGAATNVAWITDSPNSSTSNGHVISMPSLSFVIEDEIGTYHISAASTQTPRITIDRGESLAAQTITFTAVPLDLGAVPTGDVEFFVEARTPGGSTVAMEIRNDADTAWVPVTSGQTDSDLTGVGKNQTYDFRLILTPSGDVAPIVWAAGAREVTRTDITELVEVTSVRWSVNPITCIAEIPEATFLVVQDGVRDFKDFISRFLTENDFGDLSFRVFYGDRNTDRQHWIHEDDFFLDRTSDFSGRVPIVGVGIVSEINQELPVWDAINSEFTPYIVTNQTLKAAVEDLVDGQIGLEGKYRGPLLENTTLLVSNIIRDSNAMDELQALGKIGGVAFGSSQGRLQGFELYPDAAAEVIFPAEDIDVVASSPGWEHRVPVFVVRYAWDESQNEYRNVTRYIHGAALTKLRLGRVESQNLPDRIQRWIDSSATADSVGNTHIKFFGAGLIQFAFRTVTARPDIELGTPVVFNTSKFLARDPNIARVLKGNLWVRGRVVDIADVHHRELTVWVPTFADIFAAGTAGSLAEFLRLRVRVFDDASELVPNSTNELIGFDNEEYDTHDAHNLVTNNERILLARPGSYKVDVHVAWSSTAAATDSGIWTAALEFASSITSTTVIHAVAVQHNGVEGEFDFTVQVEVPPNDLTGFVQLRVTNHSGTHDVTILGDDINPTTGGERTSVTVTGPF